MRVELGLGFICSCWPCVCLNIFWLFLISTVGDSFKLLFELCVVLIGSATMTDRKAVIKNADMSEDMQQDAVDCATAALEKYNIEKDIAAYIKKEFDKKYNPTWHCIVGRNFGSYVTHETKHFIYFYLGQVAILLFKSGWTINTLWQSRALYRQLVVTWSFF